MNGIKAKIPNTAVSKDAIMRLTALLRRIATGNNTARRKLNGKARHETFSILGYAKQSFTEVNDNSNGNIYPPIFCTADAL